MPEVVPLPGVAPLPLMPAAWGAGEPLPQLQRLRLPACGVTSGEFLALPELQCSVCKLGVLPGVSRGAPVRGSEARTVRRCAQGIVEGQREGGVLPAPCFSAPHPCLSAAWGQSWTLGCFSSVSRH